MYQMASLLALLALNFLPMMGLDAKDHGSQAHKVKDAERERNCSFSLCDFQGNFILLGNSTGAVSNQNISQYGYGQSAGQVAQVCFDNRGNGTVNFMSFTAFSGALTTAYTSNAGEAGYPSPTCPALPFPSSQNIMPMPSADESECTVSPPVEVTLTLVLTQPEYGAGYAVLENMPTVGAVTYFDFVASRGGESDGPVQTLYLNLSQTNIEVNNYIIEGNYGYDPFLTLTSTMIRQ